LSGIDAESDKIAFKEWIKSVSTEIQTFVYNDTITNLSSGFFSKFILQRYAWSHQRNNHDQVFYSRIHHSGTGSVVLGTDGAGKEVRAGGWGPLLGDEGGGYVIAHDALCAYTACVDGTGDKTILVEKIKKQLGLKNDYDVVSWTYSDLTWARIANLATLVFEASEEGDQVAKKILEKAVNGMIKYASIVVKKLNWSESKFQIVLCGSEFFF
jgi:hypothetical protein